MKRLLRLLTVLLLASVTVAQADINAFYPGYGVARAQASGAQFSVGIPTKDFEYFAAPQTAGHQRSLNWCWAACVQMVLNDYGIYATQEEIVQRNFGRQVDTTANASQIASALTGWGRNIRGRVSVVSAAAYVPNSVNAFDLLTDLSFRRPLIVGLNNPGMNTSHAYVLTAVEYCAGQNGLPLISKAVLRDPWPGNQSRLEISGQEFLSRLNSVVRVAVQNY